MRSRPTVVPIALACLALMATPACAQFIIGATAVDIGGGESRVRLVHIAQSGVVTLLGSGPTTAEAFIAGQGTAYDETGNRYFFFGNPNASSTNTFYIVNLSSGLETSAAVSGLAAGVSIVDIEYDDDADTLYTLLNHGASGNKQLGTIATTGTVGAVTALGSPFGPFTYSTSELDETGNFYYFIGAPNFYGASTVTNTVAAGNQGPISPLVLGFEADRSGGVVYALQVNNVIDRRIVEIDTAGTYGAVVNPGPDLNGGAGISTAGDETFDPVNNIYYFLGTPTSGSLSLYAVDAVTKALVATFPHALSGAAAAPLHDLEFDAAGPLQVALESFGVD